MQYLILSCNAYPYANDDIQQLAHILQSRGYETSLQPWQDVVPHVLDKNTSILPLAVWDYSFHYTEFIAFLDSIMCHSLSINNSLSLIHWNINKRYLFDLEQHGFPIIPTYLIKPQNNLKQKVQESQWENPVFKPLIGQSGKDVCRFDDVRQLSFNQDILMQKFIPSIQTHGEVCLVFFKHHFQYAIHRIPTQWRANSLHGVSIKPIAAKPQWIRLAERIIDVLPEQPLYMRVDILPQDDDGFFINEVELIEPSLYFRYSPHSLLKFVQYLEEG